MRQRELVTLKMIASATGFSVNTVSRALKDAPGISPETRELIKEKARALGYIGNMLASSMRSGLTRTMAVILSDIANPHFAILVKDIVEYLLPNNYSAFVLTTNEDEQRESDALKAALSQNVDGIIICPTQKSTANVEFLIKSGIPFVLIGRYFENYETNYVICNDKMGGYQATKYLMSFGHKEIMFLNGELYISSASDRQNGYRQALEEAGLPFRSDLICHIPVLGRFDDYFESIFNKPVSFTAIIAFSDMLAWELMDYLQSSGFSIPRDMSVIAFDDLHSRYVMPFKLSSVISRKERMSHIAAEILLKKIFNPDDTAKEKIVLTTKVIQRSSCFAPRETAPTASLNPIYT